jgi:NAD(P)H dehydrogenase (quinone)
MTRPTIVVTGASGKTGGALVRELLKHDVAVRAVVHHSDARSEDLRRQGAEVVQADLFDPDDLLDALKGAQRAYYLPFFHPSLIQSAVAFSLAAREARLEQVVHLTQWISHRAHPSNFTRQLWLVDGLMRQIPGIAHTTINPGMFADNFLRVIDFAALLGIFPYLSGEGRAAPVSNEDIARVAAAVLLDPVRHDGMTYRPTGPALLSGPEMARVVAGVVGHRVVPVKLPWWLFYKVARQQRVNPLEVSSFRVYMEEMERGSFALDGGVTTDVQDLTGAPAESFEATARRYAAMPFARQSLANRAAALVRFNLVPFYRGIDPRSWERQHDTPTARHPTLAIDDLQWLDDRHRQMRRQSGPIHERKTVLRVAGGQR